ncbi:hypothetical protein GCM10028796_53340 [Ramlibacter monticola]
MASTVGPSRTISATPATACSGDTGQRHAAQAAAATICVSTDNCSRRAMLDWRGMREYPTRISDTGVGGTSLDWTVP